MQLRITLLTRHFKKILESIFTKIKRGSFQKPDTVINGQIDNNSQNLTSLRQLD